MCCGQKSLAMRQVTYAQNVATEEIIEEMSAESSTEELEETQTEDTSES